MHVCGQVLPFVLSPQAAIHMSASRAELIQVTNAAGSGEGSGGGGGGEGCSIHRHHSALKHHHHHHHPQLQPPPQLNSQETEPIDLDPTSSTEETANTPPTSLTSPAG